MKHALLAVALLALTTLTACDVNEYCLNCATEDGGGNGDGGSPDAITDGGAMPDTCIPTGVEVCDSLDNDCDGDADEDVPTVGDACGADVGVCTVGVIECNGDEGLECSGDALQGPEACDDMDNDCDGTVDDNNPEGGERCGTDLGTCEAGITQCIAGGVLDCVGDMGMPGVDPELCDGQDNDCDGDFDEGLPAMGSCGATEEGECTFGTLMCVGGGTQCVDYEGPTFEVCDTTLPVPEDTDCDGLDHNNSDLDNDVRNCNGCGVSCIGTVPNATAACKPVCVGGANAGDVCDVPGDCPGGACGSATLVCAGGTNAGNACTIPANCPGGACVSYTPGGGSACDVGNCNPGFYDIASGVGNEGCEYACDFQGPQEDCNSEDDNCNGVEDEGLMPPPICSNVGACASTTAVCTVVDPDTSLWECNYGGTVSTDLDGNIIPESQCDGIDNDCDTRIDEGDPSVLTYTACSDAAAGVCQRFGHMVCDPANVNNAPICSVNLAVPIVDSGGAPSTVEICDGKDNDCDTFVDDGIDGQVTAASRDALQTWVPIGGTAPNQTFIMAYEASRPDALDPDSITRTITGITRATNVVTVTTATTHGFLVGNTVVIAGVTDTAFNGNFVITAIPTTTTFRYTQTAANATSSGGTASKAVPALGTITTYACSRALVHPWINIDQPSAEAACAAVGGRMCTEQEWHQACAGRAGLGYPVIDGTVAVTSCTKTSGGIATCTTPGPHGFIVGDLVIVQGNTNAAFNVTNAVLTGVTAMTFTWNAGGGVQNGTGGTAGNGKLFFEAEDYASLNSATSGGVLRTWVPDYSTNGAIGLYSGISAMRASPNTGADLSAVTALTEGPRLNYTLTLDAVQGAVAHYVWVRSYAPNTGDNAIFIGFSGSATAVQPLTPAVTWTWQRVGPFAAPGTGTKTITIYMDEDGVRVDALISTQSTSATAPTDSTNNGNDFPYSDTYNGGTCNGEDNDGDVFPVTTGDQDDVIATGAEGACTAEWGAQDVFDMSGNVKEWTFERFPATNPLRGGASNNEQQGLTCSNAFTLADDDFKFNNVGFRCCKGP